MEPPNDVLWAAGLIILAVAILAAGAGWAAARVCGRPAPAAAPPAPASPGRIVVDGPPDVAAVIVIRARTVQTVIPDEAPAAAPEEPA